MITQSASPLNPTVRRKGGRGRRGWWEGASAPNAQYLHQLDRQDGGAHQSPLGLFWLGELEGGTAWALRRPSGHITGLALITSCHTDESLVKVTLADVQ